MSLSVLVVGPHASGKTSLVRRMMDQGFSEVYTPTDVVSVEFTSVKSEDSSRMTEISFLDTGGTESDVIEKYSDQDVYVVVYDLQNENSLEEIQPLVTQIEKVLRDYPYYRKPMVVIVGNKTDRERKIPAEKGLQNYNNYGTEQKAKYLETSAKTGENVQELLNIILRKVEMMNSASRRSSDLPALNMAMSYNRQSACCNIL